MAKAVQYALISSGGNLSPDINIANAREVAVHFPVVTSCHVLIEAGFTGANSASYFPLSNPSSGSALGAPSKDLELQIGAGSKTLVLTPYVTALTAFRLKTSQSQTDNRSLAITVTT